MSTPAARRCLVTMEWTVGGVMGLTRALGAAELPRRRRGLPAVPDV
ncbi:MAG: hypothetical protein MR433_00875 [Coriobacteriaceae bacterium]|nr:hypothetical protein [Coriobacteriaceae bacterium]